MVEWNRDAIIAALGGYWGNCWRDTLNDGHAENRMNAMRAALDAAVKAQGLYCDSETAFAAGYTDGHKDGCAEAFEEAAKIAGKQGWCGGGAVVCGTEISAAIRLLAKSPPK